MLVFALINFTTVKPEHRERHFVTHNIKIQQNVTKMNRNALLEINQSDFNLLFEFSGSILPYCYSHTSSFVCVIVCCVCAYVSVCK